MVVVGLTVIALTPDAPFDHVTVPLQPVWVMVLDCPAQIVPLEAERVGAAGFGLTVIVKILLASLTQPLDTVVQVAV